MHLACLTDSFPLFTHTKLEFFDSTMSLNHLQITQLLVRVSRTALNRMGLPRVSSQFMHLIHRLLDGLDDQSRPNARIGDADAPRRTVFNRIACLIGDLGALRLAGQVVSTVVQSVVPGGVIASSLGWVVAQCTSALIANRFRYSLITDFAICENTVNVESQTTISSANNDIDDLSIQEWEFISNESCDKAPSVNRPISPESPASDRSTVPESGNSALRATSAAISEFVRQLKGGRPENRQDTPRQAERNEPVFHAEASPATSPEFFEIPSVDNGQLFSTTYTGYRYNMHPDYIAACNEATIRRAADDRARASLLQEIQRISFTEQPHTYTEYFLSPAFLADLQNVPGWNSMYGNFDQANDRQLQIPSEYDETRHNRVEYIDSAASALHFAAPHAASERAVAVEITEKPAADSIPPKKSRGSRPRKSQHPSVEPNSKAPDSTKSGGGGRSGSNKK